MRAAGERGAEVGLELAWRCSSRSAARRRARTSCRASGATSRRAELVRRLRSPTSRGRGPTRDPSRLGGDPPDVALDRSVVIPAVAACRARSPPAARAAPPPAGRPIPTRSTDRPIYDYAGVLAAEADHATPSSLDVIEDQTKAEVVVYTQVMAATRSTTAGAEADAEALIDQWGVGRRRGR